MELSPEKRRIVFDWDGLYYGEEALNLYLDWKSLDYSVIEMFGVSLMELPPNLKHDLVLLKKMDMWHQWNVKQPKITAEMRARNPIRRAIDKLTHGRSG